MAEQQPSVEADGVKHLRQYVERFAVHVVKWPRQRHGTRIAVARAHAMRISSSVDHLDFQAQPYTPDGWPTYRTMMRVTASVTPGV